MLNLLIVERNSEKIRLRPIHVFGQAFLAQ